MLADTRCVCLCVWSFLVKAAPISVNLMWHLERAQFKRERENFTLLLSALSCFSCKRATCVCQLMMLLLLIEMVDGVFLVASLKTRDHKQMMHSWAQAAASRRSSKLFLATNIDIECTQTREAQPCESHRLITLAQLSIQRQPTVDSTFCLLALAFLALSLCDSHVPGLSAKSRLASSSACVRF